MYNLIYKNKKINSKPLTKAQADAQISAIIMNYGYKPQAVEIK